MSPSNHAPIMAEKKKRTSKGKQKIVMKKIDKLQSRHVTFSKRRPGLFKKCAELHSLCGADVAAFTFSIAGKPISCGYPSAEAVLQRYVHDSNYNNDNFKSCWWDKPIDNLGLDELQDFKNALEGFRNEVVSRVDQLSNSCNNGGADEIPKLTAQVTNNNHSDLEIVNGFDNLGCIPPSSNNNATAAAAQLADNNNYQETPLKVDAFDFGWIDEVLGSQITDYSSLMLSESSFSESFQPADASYQNMLSCC